MFSRTDTLSQLETCMDCDSNVNDFLTQAPTLLLQTCVHTRKEPRKPSLSSGNRCRTVHSCDDVLTHEHCGGAATMLKSSDTKQLSRASRAVTPEGCSDVEASHHQPARAHGSSAGRSAHFWRRGRARGTTWTSRRSGAELEGCSRMVREFEGDITYPSFFALRVCYCLFVTPPELTLLI